MDEKKIRKSVQMLHIEKKECKKILDFHGNKQWNSGILRRKIRDCNTAIEALEKQLPKKTKRADEQRIRYCTTYVCPGCGKEFTGMVSRYCYRFGQRIEYDD